MARDRRPDATARPEGKDPDTSKYPGGGSTTGSDHPEQDADQQTGEGRGRGQRPPARRDPAGKGQGAGRSTARTAS
jgi:hypothetical protein